MKAFPENILTLEFKMKTIQNSRYLKSYCKAMGCSLIILLIFNLSFCAGGEVKKDAEIQPEVQVNVLEQDPFFTAPPRYGEYFRVLITEEGYFFKNVGNAQKLDRKPDPEGDKEQFKIFKKYNNDYDFKDWTLTTVIKAKLNPHRGELEHLEFLPGFNPKSWQSGKLFQEDLSRFTFVFPQKEVSVYEFLVSYEWRIKAREGLSEEEVKKKAIEFLNSQVQGR